MSNFNSEFDFTPLTSQYTSTPTPMVPPLFHAPLPSLPVPQTQPPLYPPASPSPGPNSSAPIIKPIFIDGLAQDFKLENQQRLNLHAFVKLGSLGGGLSQADLATRLYLLAVVYSEAAERRRITDEQGVSDLKGLFTDLKIRLEETFTFNGEQRTNIRSVAQDVIYQANRTSFVTMHLSVETIVSEDRSGMKMGNIYGSPAREKQLLTLIKRTCSSVRNAFRVDIKNSVGIDCNSVESLEEFTYRTAMKYKRGGAGEKLDIGFTIHNALLRKFALDNPQLVQSAEVEESDTESQEGSPVPKKRKASQHSGRVPNGKHFWAKVDAWFAAEILQRGRNFASPSWKIYIDGTTAEDSRRFRNGIDVGPTGEAVTGTDDDCPAGLSGTSQAGTFNGQSVAVGAGQGESLMNLL
ncbi:hypothetical protein Hypma_002123 [Hypsizygus marmoreus]|uniref:Uncharacterized protein n=1 Tax=Hypsizygus marmoreus TaxID=39966 RepID=A0A369K5P7_HYPMA|nr:hypothetical protein Hypma_002123 [Hypsizygus marmoreus]